MRTLILLVIISLHFFVCAFKLYNPDIIHVSSKEELQKALDNAKPGQTILLASGYYTGQFKIPANVNGTEQKRIILRGGKDAVLETGDHQKGTALYFEGNAYWKLEGFTIKNSKKALMVDKSNHITVDGISIFNIGEEGVHFRRFSSYNILQNCTITNTGLLTPGFGEGCYIGSAESNWSKYTGGLPDTCNYNMILNNVFGPHVAAESIDVKEGTRGGLVSGNTFNGSGMKGENYADSWMDIKGNNYIIEHNTGNNTLLDGFQVHHPVDGSGEGNIFRSNTCNVNAGGYGFNIQLVKGDTKRNIIYKNNIVQNATMGFANIPLTE
jgi:hypothetical protein